MTERKYELKPRDVLFFRDARPMDADKAMKDVRNIGHGAIWPRPDHLFKGVIHALLKETPDVTFGDFPSLKVVGPYPVKDGTLYLPRPLDWDMLIELCTGTDLPEPLEYGFIDHIDGKKKYPAWITVDDYAKYLRGEDRGHYDTEETEVDDNGKKIARKVVKFPYSDGELFGVEPRIGTTLDSVTGASKRINGKHASGQYQGEYLRLKKNVSMWCAVDTGKIGMKADAQDAPEVPRSFVMGGQNGIVTHCETDIDLAARFPRPKVETDGEIFVRWTLIAPALFQQTGWLPGWCRDSRKDINEEERKMSLGKVMFPDCEGCSLVGACTGKPIYFSGWDMAIGIKPTMFAVPQGSVYLFRCENKASAEALINKLHLQRKSDLGPQGFGIGLCSIVKPDTRLPAEGQDHENQ
ncbi:MAG: hypothetical protein IKR48_06665 [Kiritimatiellae bacterium]|nr:hypothetical protein [Kiritimatiellia bacterium]